MAGAVNPAAQPIAILAVDDEPGVLALVRRCLDDERVTLFEASNGKDALAHFPKGPALDLLITDLVMPNMSGRELIERIQQLSPSTRILCSSGYVRATNLEEQDSYLQKPFTSQDLLRKVKQVLASAPPPATGPGPRWSAEPGM